MSVKASERPQLRHRRRDVASSHNMAKSSRTRLIHPGSAFSDNGTGGSPHGIISEEFRNVLRAPPTRIVAVIAASVTAAHFIGPVLAAGLGVTVVRLAMNQPIPPLAGAIEAGLLASLVWWAFVA